MYLTVTPNPVVDKLLFIEEWRPGETITSTRQARSVGGKGLDASVAFRHLGQKTSGLHFTAGKTGQELLELLAGYGIDPEPVWVEGETRTASIIVETAHHRHTHIFSGNLAISQANLDALYARCRQLLAGASWLLTGGLLPPSVPTTFFQTLAFLAQEAGVPFLVDSWRQPLLDCLPARPAIVKMNRAEFGWTFGVQPSSMDELKKQAGLAYARHKMQALVVTCGSEGILAFTPQGAFQACPPPQVVVNAAGAGDVASAALVWRLAEGDAWPAVLTWTAAASAASCRSEGTADFRMQDAQSILPEVKCVEFKNPPA